MANNNLTGSIGPKMSPAAKRSLNEDPANETGPLDVLPLSDGPNIDQKTESYGPARYEITGEDRLGRPIKMIREDR